MRIKRTVVSALAVLALMAAVMTPAAMAQNTTEDTASATVRLRDGGTFDIEFCGAVTFDETTLKSTTETTVSSGVEICYEDTVSSRSGFQLLLSADDFTSGSGGTIPASNLTLGTMYNPLQGQWGDGTPDVGDIGAWAGPTGQQVTGHYDTDTHGTTDYDAAVADLSTPRFIAYSYDGVGTAGDVLQPDVDYPFSGGLPDSYESGLISSYGVVDGTYQVLGLDLLVTSGVPAGLYTSTLTLTYVPQAGYP